MENRPQQDPKNRRLEDERWSKQQETLRRAAAQLAKQRTQREVRAMSQLATADEEHSLTLITESLEDSSKEVRSAAVRALYRVNPEYAASFFNTALREGPVVRRRTIGAALAGSGLVNEAIEHLKSGSRQNVYDTVTLLFLVAKAGEVQPLVGLLEDYPGIELRLALIELLALSGETTIVPTLRRLAVQRSLPPAVRSAVMEAIYQITTQTRDVALEE
ncbi:MAG TPA: HEAT repeat domain-containing protein [Pyrinomonadaceae bacterium]|nr:HEAT repeat domain-containing protein [Pyrinomonadaceae bacterium]